jgi:succinyl-diaminopimelate desuccinylase
MTLSALQLAENLIARPSVTPADHGCQTLISELLTPLGFVCEHHPRGPDEAKVSNLWALRRGRPGSKLLVFAGHTDVVPTGPLAQWQSNPFVPTHRGGKLYGRGAADMKTSIAAMLVAIQEFIAAHGDQCGGIALLITSDEEGPSVDGTIKLCELLSQRQERLDYCIVGEATCVDRLGDMIKNGRRGSLSGKLKVIGLQGHIAYPQLAKNPIHQAAPALAELTQVVWDQGNRYFPATSWQMSNIHAGTGANNVIPGEMAIDFNFRFSTESTPESLKSRLCAVLDAHQLKYEIQWTLGGEPFLTPEGALSRGISQAILDETGITPTLSTTGGTSDGRFIAKICPEVVEFGPVNASIHQIDEHVDVASIEPLKNIYRRTLENLLL